jgi:hypothetical protein
LRNELRSPDSNQAIKGTYNWATWHTHMKNITLDLHKINPKAVTFLSGLGFDTDLSPLPVGKDMGSGVKFRKSEWPKDKIALELHRYDNFASPIKDCNELKKGLWRNGWNAMDHGNRDIVNPMPVVMTEFGFDQNPKTAESVYSSCLKDFFVSRQAGWMYWVLAGSYYKRQGTIDSDEKWGK